MAWHTGQQELKVENFYSSGVERYHEYHGGYLSFGYWKRAGITYVQAAENLLDLLCAKLNMNENSVLCDVGCGMGAQDFYILEKSKPKKIEALDATRIHIHIAKERALRCGTEEDRISFIYGTALSMPYPDNHFSHLLSVEAPEHFNTREKFFTEAYRVLQPGGVVVMSDFSMREKPKTLFGRIAIGIVAWLWQVPKANLYANALYKEKVEKAGFTNVSIENIGKDVIPGYYFEHRRPESVREIRAIRGFWAGVVGGYIIDRAIYGIFMSGLCEYILVKAEKPE